MPEKTASASANVKEAATGASAKEALGGAKGAEKGKASKPDIFFSVFAVLMGAMSIRQNTVLEQSKVVSANSAAQNSLNKQNGEIKFSILPYGAGNATINRVQDQNQQYAAAREDIQNALITARQNAQVEMTQTSTNVNILEQDASENSKWVGTLNTIFKVIDEMTQA